MLALIAFIFLVLRALGGNAATARRPDVAPLLKLVRTADASPEQLRAGAHYATLIGYAATAQSLTRRADFVQQVRRVVAALQGEAAQAEPQLKSPWPEVAAEAWQQYVTGSRLTDCERGGRTWLVGQFGLAPRLLEEIGLMIDVQRAGDGWAGVWTGAVAPEVWPIAGQIQALSAISRLHRESCAAILESAIGTEVQGRVATLSGLLAVALRAGGCKGLASWLAHPAEREKFRTTTNAYIRQNGLF